MFSCFNYTSLQRAWPAAHKNYLWSGLRVLQSSFNPVSIQSFYIVGLSSFTLSCSLHIRLSGRKHLIYCYCTCIFCELYVLLVSSWARYLENPFSLTLSPRRWRNSSIAGPADSLLYISSSLLWPAMQYIIPTFRWKLNYRQSQDICNKKGRHNK